MGASKWTIPCAMYFCAFSVSHAAETQTYTYDVFGRLTDVLTSGGAANGVARSYQYDGADNRTLFSLTGGSAAPTVSMTSNPVANATSAGVSIGVNMSGGATGIVTFTENGVLLGSAFIQGGQAAVFLQGLSMGVHTITASYAGDVSTAPFTYTFSVRVQNLSWLPAVLELLLSN